MCGQRGDYLFTWKIENFSLGALENETKLESPVFKAENIDGSDWYLSIYPKGHKKGNTKFVSLFLNRVQNDHKENTNFVLELIDTSGKCLKKSTETYYPGFQEQGCPHFIAQDELVKKMKFWKKDILTINCRLRNNLNVSITHLACGSEAWIKIGYDRCCFQWLVNYSNSSFVKSIKKVFIRENSQFRLFLTAPYDEIEITLDGKCPESKAISCTISLMNLKGVEVASTKDVHVFKTDTAGKTWKISTSFLKNILKERKEEFIQNNSFILKCEILLSTGEFLSGFNNVKYKFPSTTPVNDSFSALQKDLCDIFKTKKNSDIQLRVQSQLIPVHKLILSARSPVFSAMFDQNMLENQTGIVDIEDLSIETLNFFLEFLYTGRLGDLNFETVMKLLIAADKYQVSSLIAKCSTLQNF